MPLPMPSNSDSDLTEKAVSNSAEQVSDVVESIVEGDIASNISPLRISNVSTPMDTYNCLANTVSAEGNSIEAEKEEIEEVEVEKVDPDTGRYILPPRPNRGVPPKRYTPEKVDRKKRYSIVNLAKGHLSEMARAFENALYEEEEIPQTWEEAMKHEHWREAMKKEIDPLLRNHTWEKCVLPRGKQPVGCRWVFTIKRRPDGSIERYKARLVAKGYTQTYGVDYSETFSPVAKMNTVRVLLSIAANRDWPLHQFDVTNAFLHGELKKEEEVYMEAPPGFATDFEVGEGCRLRKTLYGLKQSPRVWFGKFSGAMISYGYTQSNSDHTLFLKKRGDKITCLIIYVDDMIIIGDDLEEIEDLKKNLFQEFEMKDLGNLKYFLGIEVLRSTKGIFL